MTKKPATTDKRTLLITTKGGQLRKVEIPGEWTVTYGPVVVGASRRDGGDSPNVLRLYSDASKKNLMAVFKDVVDFMDETVDLKVKTVQSKTKTVHKAVGNGQQAYTATVKTTSWRDPYADESEDTDLDDRALQDVPAITGFSTSPDEDIPR